MTTLTHRAALVTGSTSGIGKGIALRLLRSGYAVALNYSHNHHLAAAVLADCKAISDNVLVVKADVSMAADAERLIDTAIQHFGSLDVLVNNAATVADKPLIDMTEQEWDQVIGTNLKGAFLCSQHAARHMLDQADGGIIINIGAITGLRARPNGVNTCASKAGLMLMTQCLALELGPKIRANTIIPGLTLTEETAVRFGLADEQVRKTRASTIPMGRIGTPHDVADAVMLLLSDEAKFITGQKIMIDGGQYMW
jgi:3-oxoacyl-[acyl-carrier protein] reductase